MWRGAETEFRAALAKEPETVNAGFDLAELDLKREQYGEAEGLLRAIVAGHPDDAGAQRDLALAYAGEGKVDEAVEPLQAWAKLDGGGGAASRAGAGVCAARAERGCTERAEAGAEVQSFFGGGLE